MVQDNNNDTMIINLNDYDYITLHKVDFDEFSWWVDKSTGEVWGLVGSTLWEYPMGKLSVKSNFSRWLQIPPTLIDEDM
jgi:hypothetical protein